MMSSVSPSEKYVCSGSPERLSKGSTATRMPARPAAAATKREVERSTASSSTSAKPAKPAGAVEAWTRWLDAGTGVPKGLMAFLRAASVSEGTDGTIHLAGLAVPAAERLGDPAVLLEIREGLRPHLGRAPTVVVDEPGALPAPTARVTEEDAREDTLKALFRQEPHLRQAVEELDLELME